MAQVSSRSATIGSASVVGSIRPTFVTFTSSLDSQPVNVVPMYVVYVRLTRTGQDAGPQGTLIVTTASSPDNRVVVTEDMPTVLLKLSGGVS